MQSSSSSTARTESAADHARPDAGQVFERLGGQEECDEFDLVAERVRGAPFGSACRSP